MAATRSRFSPGELGDFARSVLARFAAGPVVTLLGCTNLPAIELDVCGNAVVEARAGEDCDSFATAEGARCAPPGEVNQCRYTCGDVPDGTHPNCPPGMACSTDGVCRVGSGAYSQAPQVFVASPHELLTGDFDGDGRDDLLEVVDGAVRIHHFDGTGTLDSSTHVIAESIDGESPAVGKLSVDDVSDVVLPSWHGVVGLIGSADRTPRFTAYPGIIVRGLEDLALASAVTNPAQDNRENIVLGTINGISGIAIAPAEGQTDVLGVMSGRAAQLAGPMAVANFDERPSSPCDEVVLSYRDDLPLVGPPLVFFPMCVDDPVSGTILNHTIPAIGIDVRGAHIEYGARALDVNRDGHLDLVLGVSRAGAREVDVSYGVGDGTFSDTVPDGSGTPGNNRIGTYGPVSAPPLVVAFLDSDSVLDYASATEVRLSRGGPFGSALAGVASEPFVEAIAADLNANGVTDLVAVSGKEELTYFMGSSDERFTVATVLTEATAALLLPGDYDGDGVTDVAFVERLPESSETLEDSVSIAFGRPWGLPEPPVSVGRLDRLQQLSKVDAVDAVTNVLDGAADFATVSKLADGTIAVAAFAGNADRAVRSPYAMSQSTNSGGVPELQYFTPLRLMLGDLTGDGHVDLVQLAHPRFDQVTNGLHLWLTPGEGDAHLLVDRATVSSNLPDTFPWDRSMGATIDLDGDGTDEIVSLGYSPSDPATGLSVVARIRNDGTGIPSFVVEDPTPLPYAYERVEGGDESGATIRSRAARTADMDGDGLLDVVALAGKGTPSVVTVFFGTGQGRLEAPVAVPLPDGSSAEAFTLIGNDANPAPEIAMLSGGSVYVASLRTRARGFEVAAVPVVAGAAGVLLAAADFDGDGVDDLAIGGSGVVEIFTGIPVRR